MKFATPTADIIAAAKSLQAARKEVKRLRPIVSAIQLRLLVDLKVRDEDGYLIRDVAKAWEMSDASAEQYYPALDAAYQSAGFDLAPGFCPFLLAESAERAATHKFNELCQQLVPETHRFDVSKIYNLEKWRQLTEINFNYVSKFF